MIIHEDAFNKEIILADIFQVNSFFLEYILNLNISTQNNINYNNGMHAM